MARGQTMEESHQWHHQFLPFCKGMPFLKPKLVSDSPPFESGLPLTTRATEHSENEVPGQPRTGPKKPGSVCLRTCGVLGTFPLRVLTIR